MKLSRLIFAFIICLSFSFLASPTLAKDNISTDFSLYNLEDNLLDLEEIRNQSATKLIAVDFFSMYCAPCKKALPKWEQLSEKYSNRGLKTVIVAIPTPGKDRGKAIENLRNYFGSKDFSFPVAIDKYSMVAKQYGVVKNGTSELPQAFLIHQKGEVIERSPDVDKIKRDIRKRLREESKE